MWKNEFKDVGHPKAAGGLLVEAYSKLVTKGHRRMNVMVDDNGLFAYRMDKCILVAKAYVYGNVVSAHKEAINSALNNGIPLVMYIGETKAFYEFKPKEILSTGKLNMKGSAIMVNFAIHLGKRYA